jgi:alkylhydroperoxidase family enzyme
MRVPAKPLGSYPFYLQPFFWNQRRKYGEVLQAALLWARAPKLFAAVAMLYGMIDRRSSPIDAALRSLVTVRVSHLFDQREQAVLDYAEAMTRSDLKVSDEQVERLRSYFDDDGIVEVTALIAFQNMSSKFNSALGVPAQGFCKMPSAEMSGSSRV